MPVIAIIIGVIGIFVTVVAFAFVFSPPTLGLTPTVVQPTPSPLGLSTPYEPENVPLSTYTPGPTQTATIVPTSTPFPTRTPFVLPTIEFDGLPLPDLTVTGISDPICVPDRIGTIIEFSIFIRNIGRASTRYFGPFDTGVYLILGQRRYGLDEWATQFNGVVGSSVTEVFNLNPDGDIKFTVVIDLKGNKDLGIEVIANAGE
ncbi:MAG: hypothetical protein HGA28_03585, partial [Anaerolineaceae bacterium]|nr:hypothetical protein [Anaerolineaceae bacterium]